MRAPRTIARGARRALAAALLAACLLGPPDAAAWVSDGWITTKVKIALLTSDGLVASDVAVDAVDGRVSLHGKVTSADDKEKAEAIARSVSGVSSIRNLLQVVPAGKQRSVEVADSKILTALQKAFAADVELGQSSISVASVNSGVVLLGGEARNSAEHLRAIQKARRVSGVRRVESQVRTAADDPSLDIWSRHELRQSDRGILDVASELWLTAETRMRLLADDRTPALDVNVDCRGQTITLFGTVPSELAKRAAEEDARSVSGVRRVRNELQVVPESKRPQVQAKDADLERKVFEAIYERPEMKRAAIDIAVSNRVVRLTGTVPSQQHRLFAATSARQVPGVRAVHEDLTVTTLTEPGETPARTE